MAVTNVVFELGPDVTIVGSDGTVLLSPISGASLNVVPQPAGTTATGSIAIDSSASLNFTLNIPAGTPGGKGDDGNDGVGVSTITATQSEVVAGSPTTITFDFGMSNNSTKQITATVPAGAQGDPGDDGISAYQVAVNNGYTGTETAWLASLVGATGESAYQAAVDGGYVGTQADWIASLKGEKGDPGPIGPIADTTDWTTQTPINARSAQAHFAVLSGANTFTKALTLDGVGYSDSTITNGATFTIVNPSATNNTISWNAEQITATGDNYAILGISSTDTSKNVVVNSMKFHYDGSITTALGTVANCGAANTFLGNNTYSGTSVTFTSSGAAGYSAFAANPTQAGLLTLYLSDGTTTSSMGFDVNGSILNSAGAFANCAVSNIYSAVQQFNEIILLNGTVVQTHSGAASTTYTNTYTFQDTNDTAIFSCDLYQSGSLVGWFHFQKDGRMYTNAGSSFAFQTETPFYGQNLGQRIQAFTTSGTISNGSVVSFPIAFSGGVITVLISGISATSGQTSDKNIANFTNTGFTYYGADAVQLSVIAVGYY